MARELILIKGNRSRPFVRSAREQIRFQLASFSMKVKLIIANRFLLVHSKAVANDNINNREVGKKKRDTLAGKMPDWRENNANLR